MDHFDAEKVKTFYNNIENVWGDDPWHQYSQKVLCRYISSCVCFQNSIVLNAGSAGNAYNIDCNVMYHVDIADEKIKGVKNAVVASIENLPFEAETFDNILCVGSVLNYCDAVSAISELSRVTKIGGNLVIEFESSWGLEYAGTDYYKKDACVISTEYIENSHVQWLYSHFYIAKILEVYGFKIEHSIPYHITDGFFSRFMCDQKAVTLTKIDWALCSLPYFKNHGNNYIFSCSKKI